MKKYQIIFVFILISKFITAQNINPINTDRPDQSDGTYVLPQNNFQIEEGIYFAENNFQNNLMLRFGISKSTEFRFLSDYSKTEDSKGLMPLGLSFKQRIIEQNKWIPAITLVGYIRIGQLASNDYLNTENPIDYKFVFQNNLTDKLSLGYNVGTSTTLNHLNYTINLGYSPSYKISLFGEYFSDIVKEETPSENFDLGILYLLNQKLQIDMAYGNSIQLVKSESYLTAGISYRF